MGFETLFIGTTNIMERRHLFSDANENPYNTPNNRYPDPMQRELKNMIAPIKKVDPDTIFLGNGSDEAIDLVYRAFCIPGWIM